MIIKQANYLINIGIVICRLVIILYCATLLAKFIWWIFTPSDPDIYVEKSDITIFDKSSKFIINRLPFGKVVAPPPPSKPAIISQMKLTGVYFDTPKNSIAFYELNNKSYIAKIGDTIGDSVVLKSITSHGIILTENNTDITVSMSGGSELLHPSSSSLSLSNNYSASMQQQYNNNLPPVDDLADKRRKLIEDFAQRRYSSESANNNGSNSGLESH